jgi:iron complex outermembrane receptor protein
VVWGLNYRVSWDEVRNSPSLSFDPADRTLQVFSAFVQDEIALIRDQLSLTIGTKVEHNEYSKWELEPSIRLAWFPADRHTFWGAVSRAIRAPSRFDTDETTPFITTPNRDFDSEKVVAYELGYRVRVSEPILVSLSTFYNRYDDLRSIDLNSAPPPAFVFANHQDAESWGFELSVSYQAAEWWRLRGGYTYLEKNIWPTDPAVLPGSDTFEANDPDHQFLIHSIMNLPHGLQLDAVGRYVSKLPGTAIPTPPVPDYFTVDVRLAWHYRSLEVALVGKNLTDDAHPEFGSVEIPRSIHGMLTWRH